MTLRNLPSVLVTGATGFVGSAIVQRCQEAGFHVRSTGRSDGQAKRLPNYLKADLLQPNSLAPLLEGADFVFHSAGRAHQFGKEQNDAAPFMKVNAEGTDNLIRAAARAGVRHFVLISSMSVYGSYVTKICDESSPCRPEGAYAESKYEAERCAIQIAELSGMPLTIMRLATVYGEGDPGNVARLIRAIDRKRFVWIGTGSNRKSMIHYEDVARACTAVAKKPSVGVNIYNVASSSYTMREIVERIASSLGRRLPRWHIPASLMLSLCGTGAVIGQNRGRLGTLHRTVKTWLADGVYDASKFEQTFGFQAQVSLEEGIQREVAWYRSSLIE